MKWWPKLSFSNALQRLFLFACVLIQFLGFVPAEAKKDFRASTAQELDKRQSTVWLLYVDFDGTLTNNEKSQSGTFHTDVLLFPSQDRLNVITPAIRGTAPVALIDQIFQAEKKHLAIDHVQRVVIDRSIVGRDSAGNSFKLLPGQYYFDPYLSYQRFNQSENPAVNHLYDSAVRAEANKEGEWRGFLWATLQQWLELKKTAPAGVNVRIVIATARGHSREEWRQAIQFWISKGHLPADMEIESFLKDIHNLGDPAYDKYGPRNEMATRKSGLLEDAFRGLKKTEPRTGELHQVILAENDQANLRALRGTSELWVRGEHVKARVTTVNAGIESEVRDRTELVTKIEPTARILSYVPERWIWIKPSEEEVQQLNLELFRKTPVIYRLEARSCAAVLGGG